LTSSPRLQKPGTIEGELIDSFGWCIRIKGVRDLDNGGYVLAGHVGEPPAALRQPVVDGE
jgi:hypothetical protein